MTKKKLSNEPLQPANFLLHLAAARNAKGRSKTYKLDVACAFGPAPKNPESISKELLGNWFETPIHREILDFQDAGFRDRTIQTLQARKLLFLFPYFNIPYGDWEQLARAIALAFVPGLKIEDGAPLKKGAPIRWTPEAYQTLLREVSEAAGSNPGLSDRRLVLKMVKSDPEKWNAKRGDTKDIARVRDNLCKRLSDAKALTEQTK